MRCQKILDQLPVLAYNELDNASAARCHEHLAGCVPCQAEWDAIRGALSLLDQAPRRATQVDLAAICLWIARQQRRGRVASRWTVVGVAAAAVLVSMIAAQLLAVNLEPGRLTVAWSAKPAPAGQGRLEPGPFDRGPADPQVGDRVGLPQAKHDGGSGAGQATPPAGADLIHAGPIDAAATSQHAKADAPPAIRGRTPNLLVLLFEGDEAFSRRRLRNAMSLDDGAMGPSFDEAFGRSREPGRARGLIAEPEPVTYSDLRRKLIEAQPKLTLAPHRQEHELTKFGERAARLAWCVASIQLSLVAQQS